MVPTDRQANLPIDLEAARGREEAEGRRLERIRRREDYATVVDAAFEGGRRGWSADGEVPFEEVAFERGGVVVWAGLRGELLGFFEDALDCG